MRRINYGLATLLVMVMFAGCDVWQKNEFRKERASSEYRSAMEDYRAGRIDQAVKGLTEVCRDDPANASARFQLACLLQDSVKDYFGALCAYAEYLRQQPDSEKSTLARSRHDECLRLFKAALVAKGEKALGGGSELVAAAEFKRLQSENAELIKKLNAALAENAALIRKNTTLSRMMTADDGESRNDNGSEVKSAKALLEDDEDVKPPSAAIAEASAVDEDENVAPPLKPSTREARAVAKPVKENKASAAEPLHEARPEIYVVQDGDTLYRIAMRFYGRSSAWKKIRDANRAVISGDGRVRTGQKLVLPK